MGFIRNTSTFLVGATVGAAAGIMGARLFAPKSGEETQGSLDAWKAEIAAAGERARIETSLKLEHEYRSTVEDRTALRDERLEIPTLESPTTS